MSWQFNQITKQVTVQNPYSSLVVIFILAKWVTSFTSETPPVPGEGGELDFSDPDNSGLIGH